MPTRLAPTCDSCGAQATGGGYTLDPETLRVLCLTCAIPDESERERIITDAVRGMMRECEEALGRRPSTEEFMGWAVDEEGRRGG